MPIRTAMLVALVLPLLASTPARAARLAPVPRAEAASTHGPFEMGACDTCHQRGDAADPGPALEVTNDLCYGCHDEFRATARVRMDRTVHPDGKAACTTCHNPHNSRKRKLRM